MAVQIVMPRLGDFMTEGIVARWAKGQGDAVAQGELIAEIESEKLNYELEATSDGILHHAVDEGATVGVDDVSATCSPRAKSRHSLSRLPRPLLLPHRLQQRRNDAPHPAVLAMSCLPRLAPGASQPTSEWTFRWLHRLVLAAASLTPMCAPTTSSSSPRLRPACRSRRRLSL